MPLRPRGSRMFATEKQYSNGIDFRSLELPGYFLDYIPGNLNHLIITFENADKPKLPRTDSLREPWGAFHLLKKGYSILGVKPKAADWYRGQDLHNFFRSDEFNTFRLSFKQIFLYGSSMGGYAALKFADACPGAIVIAYNPQTTLDLKKVPWEQRYEEGRVQDWTGDFSDARVGAAKSKKNYIAYDNFFYQTVSMCID